MVIQLRLLLYTLINYKHVVLLWNNDVTENGRFFSLVNVSIVNSFDWSEDNEN